jgi:phage protein U
VKRLKAEVARLQKKLSDADRRAKNDRAEFDIQLRRLDARLKALEAKPK